MLPADARIGFQSALHSFQKSVLIFNAFRFINADCMQMKYPKTNWKIQNLGKIRIVLFSRISWTTCKYFIFRPLAKMYRFQVPFFETTLRFMVNIVSNFVLELLASYKYVLFYHDIHNLTDYSILLFRTLTRFI